MPARHSSIPIKGSIPPGVRSGISAGFRIGSLASQSETSFKPSVVGRDGTKPIKITTDVLEKLLSFTKAQIDEVLEKLSLDLNNDLLIDRESQLSATIRQLVNQIVAKRR